MGAAVSGAVTYAVLGRSLKTQNTPTAEIRTIVQVPVVAGPSQADIDRMEKENAGLAGQLAAVRAQLAERDAVLSRTKESLAELRRPMEADIMSSALKAELKSGEVVVTGGYRLPDGKRLYAFATPVVEQVDGADVVRIESQFLSLTDEAGKLVGLDNLSTNAANTLQHGEVWVPDEQASVLAKLQAGGGVDMLTSPSITVKPGSSGMIEVGEMRLKVTPTLGTERGNMDFEVRLEQPQVIPPTNPPASPTATDGALPPAGTAAP